MKKILLVNPPFNIVKENYDSSISVGLLSIASYLDGRGVTIRIIDCARQKDFRELLAADAGRYDFVALSVMTTQIPGALEISAMIKKIDPKIPVIWGGSHPTFFIRETIEHPLIDMVSFGEGEVTLAELAAGKPLKEINGIAYKENGEIHINPPRELHDPAAAPLFNWELEPREILERLDLIPSLTSRGCPHRCTFCINAILKNRWRPRTVEQVLDDLRIIKSKEYFRNKPLRFWDENFFVDIKRAKAVIDGMIEQDLAIPWETTMRVDYMREGMVDDGFMAKLKKSGCYLLSFGAESGSPMMLTKIKKDVTPEQIVNSAKLCLKYGVIAQYSFMIGLPGETKKDMMMTLDLIDRLLALNDERVQILGPQAFRPYPGSDLYAECLAAGWQAPLTLEAWSELIKNELSYLTVANFPWVREKDLVESMEAYVRFGAHSIKSALGSSVKASRLLKLGFILVCKLRWKLKFFAWPIEFKLAKRYLTN